MKTIIKFSYNVLAKKIDKFMDREILNSLPNKEEIKRRKKI